jgi:hypothetical protein
VFLLDQDIAKLCEFYHIHMLVFEGDKREAVLGYHEGTKLKTKQVNMPHCITFHEEGRPEDGTVYMIFNGEGQHFEAVRGKDGYTIPKDVAKKIYEKYKCGEGVFHTQCKYAEGDSVEYKGKPHFVIWRKSNEDGTCHSYGLTDSEERLREFLRIEEPERGTTRVLQAYGPIVVQAEELA